MTKKAVHVDLDRCQGHGKCYMVAPEMFDFADEHGRAQFVGEPIDPEDATRMEDADRAIQACPESALSLVEHQQPEESP